jgi:hypothetical protein
MDRRAFLGLLAAAAFDPERLLWVPGRKTFFLPSLAERKAIKLQMFINGAWITMSEHEYTATNTYLPPEVVRHFLPPVSGTLRLSL